MKQYTFILEGPLGRAIDSHIDRYNSDWHNKGEEITDEDRQEMRDSAARQVKTGGEVIRDKLIEYYKGKKNG